jgi:hypothetical protein
MEHDMTDTQAPGRTNAKAPRVSGFAKGATIAGAMTWMLSLLALLTAKPYGSGFDALFALLLLVLASLFLLFVALPSLIISFVRRL